MTGLPAGERHAMARTYVAAGWSVFPLHWATERGCSCPMAGRCSSAGKHPIIARGVHAASRDRAVVDAWWRTWPAANIGLPAGDNGLAVLDVDPRHGGDVSLARLAAVLGLRGLALPATLEQRTGGGGRHLVFAAPEGGVKGGSNVFGPALPGLDTRGRGGYVVAAPSVHVSGGAYRWLDFMAECAPWPAILTRLMGDL